MICPETLAAIVVAAGEGTRFGGDKLFAPLGGRPVLAWSLDAFERSGLVSAVVLVLSERNLERGRRLVRRRGFEKVRFLTVGGPRRQDSVWKGLQQVAGWEYVAIHDGARPFVTPEMLLRGFEVARQVGGAVAAVPVKDTIKVVQSARLIEETPARANLWAAQTPQIFRYDRLVDAYRVVPDVEVTDDSQLYELAGFPCAVFMGSYDNLKITTPDDLIWARGIARQRRSG